MILDLVRRRPDSPVGTMELLILRALESFRDRGLKEASLNAIPLACVDRPRRPRTSDDDSRLRDALRWLYEHGGAVYEAKNLFRFKAKFAPRWEPIYLVYPESANLARIATTVGIAYLPNGVVATVRGLVRRKPAEPRAERRCSARGYRWCTGHEYVVRPPTVRRSSSAPSRGHTPPRARDACRSPVCDPPRRPSTRTV